jgi:membrane protein implicated in regulation of membrane protease activity
VALGWFLFLAALDVGRDRGWNEAAVTVVSLLVFAGAALLLVQAVRSGRRRRDREAARSDERSDPLEERA